MRPRRLLQGAGGRGVRWGGGEVSGAGALMGGIGAAWLGRRKACAHGHAQCRAIVHTPTVGHQNNGPLAGAEAGAVRATMPEARPSLARAGAWPHAQGRAGTCVGGRGARRTVNEHRRSGTGTTFDLRRTHPGVRGSPLCCKCGTAFRACAWTRRRSWSGPVTCVGNGGAAHAACG